ncbi:hypothetical protein TNCV_3680211 [Trichonephila clavipes]|nr:hypothetical protein TNCV_3680211 [Trichonephila clavipes]
MALYRSPLTVTLWPSSFLKKYEPMIPPAHKAHQTNRNLKKRGSRQLFTSTTYSNIQYAPEIVTLSMQVTIDEVAVSSLPVLPIELSTMNTNSVVCVSWVPLMLTKAVNRLDFETFVSGTYDRDTVQKGLYDPNQKPPIS